MVNLAVIPARRGSKRVPLKNIRYLGGKPLICHSIDKALICPQIDRVVVTTDIPEVQDIAKMFQYTDVEIVWREESLAGDNISTEDVVLDVLEKIDDWHKISAVVTLLPTSPFRTVADITSCIDLFYERGADSVATIKKVKIKQGIFDEKTNKFRLLDPETPARMDQLACTYIDNPAVYVTKPTTLIQGKFILGDDNYGYLIKHPSDFDINTQEDWKFAETIANSLKGK